MIQKHFQCVFMWCEYTTPHLVHSIPKKSERKKVVEAEKLGDHHCTWNKTY